jgi:serine/threonine protein kinase
MRTIFRTCSLVQDITIRMIEAVKYCHANGIIHRDIKPSNILVSGDLNVKLADFGLSVRCATSKERTGSPLYTAADVVYGYEYDNRVDIWSFGCMLYELYFGRVFFVAEVYDELFEKVCTKNVYYDLTMPDDMLKFIRNCLVRNPEKRPGAEKLSKYKFVLDGIETGLGNGPIPDLCIIPNKAMDSLRKTELSDFRKKEREEAKFDAVETTEIRERLQKFIDSLKLRQSREKSNFYFKTGDH